MVDSLNEANKKLADKASNQKSKSTIESGVCKRVLEILYKPKVSDKLQLGAKLSIGKSDIHSLIDECIQILML